MASNDSTCEQGSLLTPIVSNITGQGVCGFASSSSNTSALESCCQGSSVQEFNCVRYCSPPQTDIRNFLECLTESVGNESVPSLNPFCQEGITRRDVNGVPTSATSPNGKPPSLRSMLLWLIALGSLSAVQAATVTASSSSLKARQEASCTIDIANTFTTSRGSQRVSNEFSCGGLCPYTFDIDTGLNNNNRTVNGSSAAGEEYDSLFDALQNQTNRSFPALSSIKMKYGLVATAGTFFVDFTPLAVSIERSLVFDEAIQS